MRLPISPACARYWYKAAGREAGCLHLADSKGERAEQSENGLVHSAGQKRQLGKLPKVRSVQLVLQKPLSVNVLSASHLQDGNCPQDCDLLPHTLNSLGTSCWGKDKGILLWWIP